MKLKDLLKITIGKRIGIGFLSIILISALSSSYTFYVLSKGINKIDEISNNVEPSIEALNEFNQMIVNTRMYSGNWVYQQANEIDKENLREIRNLEFQQLKDKLGLYTKNWDIETKQKLEVLIGDFEDLLGVVDKEIMSKLVEFEHYNNPIIALEAADALETKIFPATDELLLRLTKIIDMKTQDSKILKEGMRTSFINLGYLIWGLILAVIIIAVLISMFTSRGIVQNVYRVRDAVTKLMKGEIPEKTELSTKDEIGEMGNAINQLIDGMNSYAAFAEEIGKGNFASNFDKLGDNDIIGNSLLTMRDNLRAVSIEEKQRAWTTEGITKISDLLRLNNENIELLSEEVIKAIVKYMEINQGGIFLVNDTESNDPKKVKLHLTGCYAYDRLKLAYKEVIPGEGFVGQCWLERETIHVTEVPESYVKITSGLGEATPTSILVCPLSVNEHIYGVIELASFSKFTDVQIEFVEKICEIIASSISSVKVSETTQKLLRESKELTESLQAQEEELRQNQEEMHATQEEAERKYQQTLKKLEDCKSENENIIEELASAKKKIEKLSGK